MLFGIQEQVRATIWYLLNNFNSEDALFLAEWLHPEVNSEESSFLLDTCYFRDGRKEHVKKYTGRADVHSPKCNLLLARYYLDL